MKTKKVLILAYRFPPFGGVGVRRLAALAKYLPQYGWEPLVVAPDIRRENTGEMFDDESYAADDLESKVLRRLPTAGVVGGTLGQKLADRMRLFMRYPVATVLDACYRLDDRFWGRAPVHYWRVGRELERTLKERGDIDLIFASFPSFAPLILGDYLSRKTGIPWVADLRDNYDEIVPGDFRHRRVVGDFQKKTVASAAAVLTVSRGCSEAMREELGTEVDWIPNGFDTDALRQFAEEEVRNDKFTLRYTGSFIAERHKPQFLFEALSTLCERGDLDVDKLHIEFVGRDRTGALARERDRYPVLKPVMHIGKMVSWAECLRLQRSADGLMFFPCQTHKGILTGKIFEYISSGVPVISVPGDHDETDAMLQETGCGLICRNAGEAEEAVMRLYRAWRDGGPSPVERDEAKIMSYSREQLTERFARYFDGVVAGAGS